MTGGIIILADSKETLINSKKIKPMCEVLFKPMLDWAIKASEDAGIDNICVVAGENLPCIEAHLEGKQTKVFSSFNQAAEAADSDIIIVLSGNKPFIDAKTIRGALEMHTKNGNDKTIISEESIGYCINSGSIGKSELKTGVYEYSNENIGLTANTGAELNRLNETMRHIILEKLMNNGVDIPCTDGIIIGPDCKIGCDTKILPNTIICGNVTIGEDCVIGPNSYVENAEIGGGVKFNNGQIRNAKILNTANIGPFVQIRPDSVIGDGVHLGNFVEVKNSTIGENTSVSHLTYVGDSDVGSGVNFGCGVVTVNFNGKTKNRTVIKDRAFIGCNTNLVAPVTVGENSYTAAGSTITHDVPDNTLAIARERQTNKEGWVKEHQPYRKKV